MTPIAKRKAQLEARLQDLQNRMKTIDRTLTAPHTQDWDDLGIERAEDEVLEGLGLSDQREVPMIEAALDRVEAGTYGICVRCGERIADARLDLLPSTPFCSRCASELQTA